MAHYAKVLNGKVVDMIVAEESFFDTFQDTSPGEWIQTSYNTFGGVHTQGGTPLRKNYAAVGHTYDRDKDAFIAPQPYPSWILNETSCLWEAPVDRPEGDWLWNDSDQSWDSA